MLQDLSTENVNIVLQSYNYSATSHILHT